MVQTECLNIIESAKKALSDLNKHSIESSVLLIDSITKTSEQGLHQLLEKLKHENEIKESRILFFDAIKTARQILAYSVKAKYAIVKKDYPTVRAFLKHIVELEKTEIKDIKKLNNIIKQKKEGLYNRLVLESSFVLFTSNRLEPFSSDIGKELDAFFKLKQSLEKKLKLLAKYTPKRFEKQLKESIFEKQQILFSDDSLANEIKHPTIVIHHNNKVSFERLFKDYVFISTLGVMSYYHLTKNLLDLVKRFKIKDRLQTTYSRLAFDFDSDYDMLVIEYKSITRSIERMNKKLTYFINKLAALKSKKALKDLTEEYTKFITSAEKRINKHISKFELENQQVHDSITQYVVRKREKIQNLLDRAEIH